tara:strand:+ start:2024 stop:3118 length:1095 start_codon:yes stop_codon:yes gene_type:complete
MADIIKELIESLNEFEVEMDKDLNKFKYDDILEKYVHLRLKFKHIYDKEIKLNSKAHDVITSNRNQTKYIKNDEALENIKNIGTFTKSNNADNLDKFESVEITPLSIVNIVKDNNEFRYIFNNEFIYEKNKKYILNTGTYIFIEVPIDHPIGFLKFELDNSDLISYYGENQIIKNDKSKPGANRIEPFYYGKVILNIKGDFNKLSVYCYNHGYMGLSNSFIYSSDSLKGYDIACLHKTSEVMIYSESGKFKYVFNGETSYNTNRRYGLGIGTYILEGVPKSHPIAIMNHDLLNKNAITYEGDYVIDKNEDPLTKSTLRSELFYWGNVRVTVRENFGAVNIWCNGHNEIGGDNLFIFYPDCVKSD